MKIHNLFITKSNQNEPKLFIGELGWLIHKQSIAVETYLFRYFGLFTTECRTTLLIFIISLFGIEHFFPLCSFTFTFRSPLEFSVQYLARWLRETSGNFAFDAAMIGTANNLEETIVSPIGVPWVGDQPIVGTVLGAPAKNTDCMSAKCFSRNVLIDTCCKKLKILELDAFEGWNKRIYVPSL